MLTLSVVVCCVFLTGLTYLHSADSSEYMLILIVKLLVKVHFEPFKCMSKEELICRRYHNPSGAVSQVVQWIGVEEIAKC